MNRLYILRHGIAVPHGSTGIAEDERPLTPKGEQRIRQVGRGLAAFGLELNAIVTSPLPRARRTAQIVAQELDIVNHLESAEVLAAGNGAEAIRDWLRQRPEPRLMIVGHNPALSDLVGLLVVGELDKLPLELKKGGMAALTASPRVPSHHALEWVATPGLLRRLSKRKKA